jgi:hypothetical protein
MQKTIARLETITATELRANEIEPLGFSVEAILPFGLFILAGSSKIGKSWLALDMSNCVASGSSFWGYRTVQGDVLYLALEDSNKRLQNRLAKISSSAEETHKPTDIHFVTKAHKLGYGLSEQIREFLLDYPFTKLIVIDTLQHIRNSNGFTGSYTGDYHDMDALRSIISGYNLSMLLITHNHKSDESDPVNKVYGSAGLTGAADGIFVLEKRNRIVNKAKLTIANRDTEGLQFELEFDRISCRWQLVSIVGDDIDEEKRLYELLHHLLDGNPTWVGTSTELSSVLTSIDSLFSMSSVTLSKTLKAQQEYLLSHHNILCTFTRNKNARLIELQRDKVVVDDVAPEKLLTKIAG